MARFGKRLRRVHERSEDLLRRILAAQVFGMPLDAYVERVFGILEPFDDAVRRVGSDAEAAADVADRLVVRRVDVELGRAEDRRQLRAGLDEDVVPRTVLRIADVLDLGLVLRV